MTPVEVVALGVGQAADPAELVDAVAQQRQCLGRGVAGQGCHPVVDLAVLGGDRRHRQQAVTRPEQLLEEGLRIAHLAPGHLLLECPHVAGEGLDERLHVPRHGRHEGVGQVVRARRS